MSKLRYNLLPHGEKRTASNLSNNFSPVKWSKYFEHQHYVYIKEDVFNVYTAGSSGPLLVLIHGGGYSGLTWSLFTEEVCKKVECQILAVDLRGHGSTGTKDNDDLSLDTLARDVASIVNNIYGDNSPPAVIIGHSLGGAVAVAAASYIMSTVGLCVIDVVEGTALESLSSMQSILRGRPSGFKSIEHAIQWSLNGGQTHNLEAARVSMPGQIKSILTGLLAANEGDGTYENGNSSNEKRPYIANSNIHKFSNAIVEEAEEDDKQSCACINSVGDTSLTKKPPQPRKSTFEPSTFKVPDIVEQNLYTWRIDLSKTESFWTGWFKGLSQKFLDVHVPKILLLANIHGLDTALTVGQMQGKFQFQVLQRSGHAIHEDQPQHVADIIAGFLVKQKLAIAKKGFTSILPAC